MGFLTEVRRIREKEREIRILFLGLDNAGKTTVVNLLANKDISKIEPTYGFNITTIYHNDNRINIWDVGGQKSIRAYWKNHYEENDAIVWVVDSTDVHRMEEVALGFQESLEEHRLSGAVLLVLANKHDLPGALDVAHISQIMKLSDIKDRVVLINACSARSSYSTLHSINTTDPINIDDLLETYLSDLLAEISKARFYTK